MQGLRVWLGACCWCALVLGCGGKADKAEGKAAMTSGPADVEHCSNLGDTGSINVSVTLEGESAAQRAGLWP